MKQDLLTAERARQLLDYRPDTGEFFWRVTRNNRTRAGMRAGSINVQGYLAVKINGVNYLGSRLAWLMTHGVWPHEQIDHISQNRTENTLTNLREVSQRKNCMNRRRRCDNTSGITGISFSRGKWEARINVAPGKRIFLGAFINLEDARQAREAAAKKYNYHPNNGRAA